MPIPSSPWVRESKLNVLERFAINIIKVGPVPRHVAFIMDGNRRFAKMQNIEKKEGHAKGFEKLSEALQWCMDIGIKEVTVYAFSIENFKRSDDEVEALMSLARDKFEKLLEEKDKLHEKGIRIQVIGNLNLLPKDILRSMAEAMILTKDNTSAILNIAFAYTSRDEITNAINTVLKGVKDADIELNDINETLISNCLYTNESTDPDLLVRTSGELRFSDFLLWQSSSSVIYFTKALWPEFKIWHLLAAILYYQQCCNSMWNVKSVLNSFSWSTVGRLTDNAKLFIEKINVQRKHFLLTASRAINATQ